MTSMKNKQGNSMQSIAAKYWAFSTVSCLFFPNGLGLATYLGVNGDNVPFFSWMSQLDGVLPFYEDYFIFIWATMPLWLIYACVATRKDVPIGPPITAMRVKSEEHTSELQSLMSISYAVFCLKKT